MECTQELYSTQSEKQSPEEIGYLGILGTKYPIKKGPNKVGRDPQTCNIVLNLNSVSRQHAVINILSTAEFMLMDLDSANKTKLSNKTLQPYIPEPLKNGDMVQFGDIFGIFRLLEDESDDLPMTQALDIPDTPVFKKNNSRLGKSVVTTIPESPDVSDKDESFIVPSQQIRARTFKTPTNNFIKAGKVISIQPVGSKKIDNVFWNSSRKSDSINLSESTDSLNISEPKLNIEPPGNDINIFEIDTQPALPTIGDKNDSIYTAETQAVPGSPSIHNLQTQLPFPDKNHLPDVQKVDGQQEIKLDLFSLSQNNCNNIFNAETQFQDFDKGIEEQQIEAKKFSVNVNKSNMDLSDEVILFDELETQNFERNFDSQPLLPSDEQINNVYEEPAPVLVKDVKRQTKLVKHRNSSEKENFVESDHSTDCEDFDILPTQKLTKDKKSDEDVTDCDDFLESLNNVATNENGNSQDILNEKETQMIENENACEKNTTENLDLEDLSTQVLMENNEINVNADMEDQPTQILEEQCPVENKCFEEALTQQLFSEEMISPFKIPVQSPRKAKKTHVKATPTKNPSPTKSTNDSGEDQFYAATQDLFDDLCTQREPSPEINIVPAITVNNKIKKSDEELVPCSVENYAVGERFPQLETMTSPTKSSDISDGEERIKQFVSNLSSQEVRNVVGVEVTKLKKAQSDPSDSEDWTPKKLKPFKFLETELPNSQEIKTSVSMSAKTLVTESSSDSESENNNSEEQYTPILFKKKKKQKIDAKANLSSKFDAEALPTRVITRVRKPTAKAMSNMNETSKNILKPKFLTEQEDNIDKEIITENITRLKNKNNKNKEKGKKEIEINKRDIKKMSTDKSDIVNKANEFLVSHFDHKTEKRTYSRNSKEKYTLAKYTNNHHNSEKSINKDTNIEVGFNSSKAKVEEIDANSVSKDKSVKRLKVQETDTDIKSKDVHTTDSKVDKKVTEEKKTRTGRVRSSRRSSREEKPTTKDKKELEKIKRTTRNSKTKVNNDEEKSKNVTKKSERKSPERETRSKRQRKQKPEPELPPEKEMRRSRRQRKDEKLDSSSNRSSKIGHDQSTVYSVADSSTDSPKGLKRAATNDISVPSPKRTRSAHNSTVTSNSLSLRATPARAVKAQRVLFTAFPPSEEVKGKLERSGAVIVTDVMTCTVLVTLQIKRTFKLLCAVGLGRPIVGPEWVQACADTNILVDPWLYIIKDEAAEKRFKFSLRETLSGRRNFLEGINVSSTPNVLPNASEMKLIVECSGGTWKEGGPQWVCVSCAADKALWSVMKKKGAHVVSTEFILGGVLRQQLDVEATALG